MTGVGGRRHGGRRSKMLYARYFHNVTGVSPIHGGKNDQQGKIYRYCEGVEGNIEQHWAIVTGLDEASTIAGARRTGVAD